MCIGFPIWICWNLLNTEMTAVPVAMAWVKMNGAQCPSQRSVCPSPMWLELELQNQWNEIILKLQVFPLPMLDTIKAVLKKKPQKTKCLKAGRVVDVSWPGWSLPIWEEPTDKGCCARVTFPCLPIGMNNEGRSPCLSFNSIFTPCQIHLGAFHHRCSPSARFSQ